MVFSERVTKNGIEIGRIPLSLDPSAAKLIGGDFYTRDFTFSRPTVNAVPSFQDPDDILQLHFSQNNIPIDTIFINGSSIEPGTLPIKRNGFFTVIDHFRGIKREIVWEKSNTVKNTQKFQHSPRFSPVSQ